MEVNRTQIINALIKFVRTDVLKMITDRSFKMSLAFIVNLLEMQPEIADKYIEKFLSKEGTIKVDYLEKALCDVMDEYGDFPISIPGIPLISPEIKTLKFNSEDVKKLKSYMEV